MKTEQEIRESIEEQLEYAKKAERYWYKLNKNPDRPYNRYYCVYMQREWKQEIKRLENLKSSWVLDEIEE